MVQKLFFIEHIYRYLLKTKAELDRERIERYSLVITARDGGQPSLESTERVEIVVNDINDNAPFFHQPQYRISVDENNEINQEITTLRARDLDAGRNGEIRYFLEQQSQNFKIDEKSGTVSAIRSLDAEKFTEPEILVVVAQDGGHPSKTGNTTLRVSIKDFNDNIPVFVKKNYRFSVAENVRPDTLVGKVLAIDGDLNPTVKYRFAQKNLPFAIDEQSGEIFVSRIIDYETDRPVYNLTALATDQEKSWKFYIFWISYLNIWNFYQNLHIPIF